MQQSLNSLKQTNLQTLSLWQTNLFNFLGLINTSQLLYKNCVLLVSKFNREEQVKQNIPPSGPGREKDQKQAVPSAILCWGRKCVSKAAHTTVQAVVQCGFNFTF